MAGSRFDTTETSGCSALLLQMLLRSNEFRTGVEALGAKVHVHTDREIQGVTLAVFNDQALQAVDLLTKVFSREFQLSGNTLEMEKEVLHRRSLEVQRDQLEQTMSCLYETTFEDHTMSLPMLGFRDNVSRLTLADVEAHRDRTFTSERVALVISGNPSQADATMQRAQDALSKVASSPSLADNQLNPISQERPLLTSTVMNVRDDEMANLNVGVSYQTKEYGSEDHFFYMYFQELIGDYNANEHGNAHVNSSDRQYNNSHIWLGEAPGITLFQAKYRPFSDSGLFTTYVHGHEVWGNVMLYMGQFFNSEFTKQVNQVDVYRARARVFNNLLNNSRVSVKNNLSIGQDLLYTGRRIGRNETARRISAMADPSHVLKKAKPLFYDQDIAVVSYGPQHMIDNSNHFSRFMKKSTLHANIVRNELYSL
jgi:processing peptidase subunit beta